MYGVEYIKHCTVVCRQNTVRGILTYSMVQSPSWEANWFAASQEIPRISQNPKVYYHTHKRPPPVPILGQPNPVHIPTSHLLEIHPNIIRPSTPRSPQWSPSLRFPQQDLIHPPLLTHTHHTVRSIDGLLTQDWLLPVWDTQVKFNRTYFRIWKVSTLSMQG